MALLRRLFEPRSRRLLTERKPPSINKKRLFAMHERRDVDRSSRGDRTAIELFLAGLRAWDKGTMTMVSNAKSKSR